MTIGIFSSRTEEWATPQYVFNWLNSKFNFNLDVCATSENAKCKNYFTKEQNGLEQDWGTNICFMNPPYGREIYKWMHKALRMSQEGATVVCLVHARTGTKWFHETAMKADEIWFVKGRLKFGDGKQSAPFPSCVVIFRPFTKKENVYNTPIIKSVVINGTTRED